MFHSKLEQCLAGLQAGMFGGITLLAVMTLVPVLDREPWWTYPDLLSGCFYGVGSINGGAGWPTISGAAFQLLIAGTGGLLFGLAFGRYATHRRITLLGLAWGLFVFLLSELFYRLASPVVWAYLPRNAATVAHMIYGVCLAGMGRAGGAEPDAPGPVHGTPVATSGLKAAPKPDDPNREVATGEVESGNRANDQAAATDRDSHG